jgi:hypothetical protein
LLWGAEQKGPVQGLDKALEAPAVRDQLAQRISFLARQPIDTNQANPADVALAIYLWLLGRHDPSLARRARDVLKVPGCGYARRAALEAQADAERAPAATNGSQVVPTDAEVPSPRPVS